MNNSVVPGKRGEFGDPENQRFLRNRGLFQVKVCINGGIFSTWSILMGHTNSLRVGVPGYCLICLIIKDRETLK